MELPDPGTNPGSPALQVDSLSTELSGKPNNCNYASKTEYKSSGTNITSGLKKETFKGTVFSTSLKYEDEKVHLSLFFMSCAAQLKNTMMNIEARDVPITTLN